MPASRVSRSRRSWTASSWMFKPLEPGLHTIVVHGTNTFGHDKTFTYYLNVV